MEPRLVAISLRDVWSRLTSWMPGGRAHDVSGGTLFSTDSPSSELSGPLIPLPGASLSTIEQARVLVRRQGRELAMDLVEGATELDGVVENEGFDRIDSRIVMTAAADMGAHCDNSRIATEDDLNAAVELQASAFGVNPSAARSLYGPGWLDTPSTHIVIELGSQVVAMATSHPTEHGIGIFGVCTNPGYRSRGHAGSAIRSAIAAVADPTDTRPVWLHCGENLVPAYESMGFESAGRTTIWVEGHV
ncbi:MAG: GNAT family N-acetyltransferase [Actinomycetia bacterium]|nr:GNAT family N-acetyltransferase [Actinomycetes bacterium]MCP4959890.1 GNAT family N-acetyltransferase [Actinomycetes bacterium]